MEKVTVEISMDEEDATVLTIATHSEIFPVGKSSRWRCSTENKISLNEAAHRGLADIVLDFMRWGEEAASAADSVSEASLDLETTEK